MKIRVAMRDLVFLCSSFLRSLTKDLPRESFMESRKKQMLKRHMHMNCKKLCSREQDA